MKIIYDNFGKTLVFGWLGTGCAISVIHAIKGTDYLSVLHKESKQKKNRKKKKRK